MDDKKNSLLDGNLNEDEFGEFYTGYIQQSRGRELFELFQEGRDRVNLLFDSLDKTSAFYRYAPEKWSILEVVGHLIDTERIMSYRALAISRGELVELPGFDQDQYVLEADFDKITLQQFKIDYNHVRSSTESLFQSFSGKMLLKKGTASGSPFTVRALGYTIAGHERHHLRILKERYLTEMTNI